MQKYTVLHIVLLPNGTVRVYGDGESLFEAVGDHVRLESANGPQVLVPSGAAKEVV